MKQPIEKRTASGPADRFAIAFTTWGVGYIPGAPGTYGSAVAVLIYLGISQLVAAIIARFSIFSVPAWPFLAEYPTTGLPLQVTAGIHASIAVLLIVFCLTGIWASTRSIQLLGNSDAPEAVVDELMGQFITFLFVPFFLSWHFILAGFLLFRLFDIWKPYPIDDLQVLPGGLGICADDIIAGVYAGTCLAIGYAVFLEL